MLLRKEGRKIKGNAGRNQAETGRRKKSDQGGGEPVGPEIRRQDLGSPDAAD